jgi:hypothetical protein
MQRASLWCRQLHAQLLVLLYYAGFHDVGSVYLVFSTWGQHLDALSPPCCYY